MEIFKNAKYIWCEGMENTPNTYVNCYETINVSRGKTYKLFITAHNDYAVYADDKLITFGQFADYPDQVKIYDEVDITASLKTGENRLTVTGYGQKISSSTQREGVSGIMYVITEDGEDICHSSLDTAIAPHPCFESGYMELMTFQVGYTFRYDSTGKSELGKATETAILPELAPRPIEKLTLKEPCPMRMVAHGSFKEGNNTETVSKRMQFAYLNYKYQCHPDFEAGFDMTVDEGDDGAYIVIDIGREEAGILSLDIEAGKDTELLIGWGEHLDDMRVRASVLNMNFASRIVAKAGRFTFVNPFRRLGCRYLELHAYGNIKLHQCTVLPTDYPVTDDVSFRCADHLHNKIYEVCKRTLLACMHEHYEDCPWREQALYTMDSRNQMLCGYYTFREKAFPRASLKLIAQSIRDDGIFELCSPARVDCTIPCFSAIYMVQLWEYVLFTGDTEFAREVLPVCEKICETFESRKAENGLIPVFLNGPYWNYYEWQDGLSGSIAYTDDNRSYDLPLNAFVSMAYGSMAKLYDALGMDGKKYANAADLMNKACHDGFYDAENGRYYSCINCKTGERFHLAQLTQSLAVHAGMCPDSELERVLDNLAYSADLLPVTTSHSVFRYDALMLRPEIYGRYVFEHIADQFGYMLYENATTFWETVDVREGNWSGSLCHGWSAIPSYLYFRYVIGLYPDSPGHMGERKPLPPELTGIYEAETDF